MKYFKKTTVEAIKYTGLNLKSCKKFMAKSKFFRIAYASSSDIIFQTAYKQDMVMIGDYIVLEDDNLYIEHPNKFNKNYFNKKGDLK